LKDIIEELDAVFPVLFNGVVLVKFLEFVVVRGKVLTCHDFVEDNLLKLMVFDFDPEIVLPLLVEILQKLVNSLQLLLL
jgi:hypothetical protein